MAYGVLAYPQLKNTDYTFIQEFRKKYDALYYSVIEPHFSFVFPVDEIGKDAFVTEIRDKSAGVASFNFEIKCAVVNKDAVSEIYHLLLVPEKGYSRVVKLHDKLYSGLLFPHLRLDIDFIPHVAIANSKDKYEVKSWADNWNREEFSIKGRVNSITIIEYSNSILTDIEKIDFL